MFSVSMSNKYHHTHPIQETECLEKLKIELGNSLPVKKILSLSSFFFFFPWISLPYYTVSNSSFEICYSAERDSDISWVKSLELIVTNSYGIFSVVLLQ